jgi:hypothetical protein
MDRGYKSTTRASDFYRNRDPGRSMYRSMYESVFPSGRGSRSLSRSGAKQPPQTVEIYEGSDTEEDADNLTLGERLGGKKGDNGYVDTIINFDEKQGQLNISNVVKIGDQYITKEWDCGEEYRESLRRSKTPQRNTIKSHESPQRSSTRSPHKNYNRSSQRNYNKSPQKDANTSLQRSTNNSPQRPSNTNPPKISDKISMRDVFDASRMTASKHLFTEDLEESVERNPTFRSIFSDQKKFKSKVDHCECDLCQQDGKISWGTGNLFSQSRSSLKKKHRAHIVKDEVISLLEEDINRSHPRSSLKRSTVKSSSPERKSVSFRSFADRSIADRSSHRNSYYEDINSRRKRSTLSGSPINLSASFGRDDEPENFVDDTAEFEPREFEVRDFAGIIPNEGKKGSVRSLRFSATKDKTKASTRGVKTPTKKSMTSNTGAYRMTDFQRGTINEQQLSETAPKPRSNTQYKSSSKRLARGERTNVRKSNMKKLAIKLKEYGELEQQEVKIRNALCMQPNYNAGVAFELLNPTNGIVTPKGLHDALRANLKITPVEKDIVADIVERLAYINEQELLLSDMIFFEPSENDQSYRVYKRHLGGAQDESDITWHRLYKELWRALINTVKQRRTAQREMCNQYSRAVDYLFQYNGLDKSEKLTEEEIEDFINDQLNTEIDQNLVRCIIQTLDRDQDGLVSYQEFIDAFYGAE